MRKKINLAVIFYGRADQLPINKRQLDYLKNNLSDFNVSGYDFNRGERAKLLADFNQGKIDTVLKNSYGREHEAEIELFLESNRIPYFGSDAKATFIGTSKYLSKQVFREHNLPVAEDVFVDKTIWRKNKEKVIKNIVNRIGFPCLVKDIGGTDSRGIYKINSQAQVEKILDKAVAAHEGVIVEEFINNAYEAVCLAVGNDRPVIFTPLGLNKGRQDFLTSKQKDGFSLVKLDIPAKLPVKIINQIKKLTGAAHRALGCRTFSRADILVAGNELYLLEVDVHTGFSEFSAATVSAKYEGMDINKLFLKFYKLIK